MSLSWIVGYLANSARRSESLSVCGDQPVTFLFFSIILEVYPINLSSEAAQGILVKKSVEAPVGCAVYLVLHEDLCDLIDLRESLGACALGQGTATDVIPSNWRDLWWCKDTLI